ncbi:MAG TPA: helix-turn-helix domain-containing protein [bacterium]|nr:helix-turn-helix domain-containing protein [bacterium]
MVGIGKSGEVNHKTYTTRQAADRVGVHKNTLLNWIRAGKVPEVERDWKNHRIWTEQDIEKLIEHKLGYMQLKFEI